MRYVIIALGRRLRARRYDGVFAALTEAEATELLEEADDNALET